MRSSSTNRDALYPFAVRVPSRRQWRAHRALQHMRGRAPAAGAQADAVLQALRACSDELCELQGSVVDRVHAPSALEFQRDYVAQNRPCIVTGALDGWPALHSWRDASYLLRAVGDVEVSVAATPDGLGDAVKRVPALDPDRLFFVMPEERRMPFRAFYEQAAAAAGGGAASDGAVLYVSHQNDSLNAQFAALAGDVERELAWASEALGRAPEATNLWAGDARATTSFHRDHYENLYAVVCGEKVFHLLPPTDAFRLHYRECAAAQYVSEGRGGFRVVPEEPARVVSWATADPLAADGGAAPSRGGGGGEVAVQRALAPGRAPLQAVVRPGEVLYLPALWAHRVAQRALPETGPLVIAVNYWYDMQFGDRFAYAQLVTALARLAPQPDRAADDDDDEEATVA